ncbi:hypothetical protein GF374_00095 [Candidatus Woesearchaeota archaeon]|nr:hypothetical protein [Candidatus Woesearchaeota archaeon]
MDHNTLCSIFYEGRYEIAMHIKSRAVLAENSFRYEIRVFEPTNGRINKSKLEAVEIGKKLTKKPDYYLDGVLFFKERKGVLDKILAS